MTEIWKTADGFSRYEVSSLGRLRRGDKIINGYPEKSRKGYLRTTLWSDDGKWSHASIHRMVCESFHGPAPSRDHHAAYTNGVNTDNAAANLRWATAAENQADKVRHGTVAIGERHGRSKLTALDVVHIREQSKLGRSRRHIADEFNVSHVTIGNVLSGRVWGHV